MPLRVLDGNQTATTLSSVVTGGEHIVAHTVVSLGATAIANIASAVSGVPISGTVTANAGNFGFDENQSLTVGGEKGILVGWYDDASGEYRRAGDATPLPISGTVTANVVSFSDIIGNSTDSNDNPQPSFNGVFVLGRDWDSDSPKTLNTDADGKLRIAPISGTVTVGNSVTIGSLPAISGTVTANPSAYNLLITVVTAFSFSSGGDSPLFTITPDLNGTWGFYGDFDGSTNCVYMLQQTDVQGYDAQNVTAYSSVNFEQPVTQFTGPQTLFVKYGSLPRSGTNVWPTQSGFKFTKVSGVTGSSISATIFKVNIPNHGFSSLVSGTVTARLQDGSGNNLTSTSIGGVQRLNVSLASAATPGGTLPSFVNVYGGADGSAVRTISVDSTGRQNTNVQLPRVTLIDGSGTVTTANTAITVFASSSTRSYLLVQVTTGSAFVNVGATATTVNGLSLTAGQGYSWETTIPQGVVSLISTTTSSRWVAKEA